MTWPADWPDNAKRDKREFLRELVRRYPKLNKIGDLHLKFNNDHEKYLEHVQATRQKDGS